MSNEERTRSVARINHTKLGDTSKVLVLAFCAAVVLSCRGASEHQIVDAEVGAINDGGMQPPMDSEAADAGVDVDDDAGGSGTDSAVGDTGIDASDARMDAGTADTGVDAASDAGTDSAIADTGVDEDAGDAGSDAGSFPAPAPLELYAPCANNAACGAGLNCHPDYKHCSAICTIDATLCDTYQGSVGTALGLCSTTGSTERCRIPCTVNGAACGDTDLTCVTGIVVGGMTYDRCVGPNF